MHRGFHLLFVLFVSVAATVAQAAVPATVRQIDAYCKGIDAYVKLNKPPHIVVAEISKFGKVKPTWQRFASVRSLQKYRETNEVFDSAFIWRRGGKTVLSNITLSSPSGDWAKYLYLYFRDDGTIAKSKSELRTFYGNFVARQNFYFDPKGNLLLKTLAFFDLNSGKPTKPAKSDLDDNESHLTENSNYKTTSSLPFAKLLGK